MLDVLGLSSVTAEIASKPPIGSLVNLAIEQEEHEPREQRTKPAQDHTPSISPHKSSFTGPDGSAIPPPALVSVTVTAGGAGATLVAAAVRPFPRDDDDDDDDDKTRCLVSRTAF